MNGTPCGFAPLRPGVKSLTQMVLTLRVSPLFFALLCLAVLPVLVLASPSAQEQVSGNLLVDGDFEAPDPWVKQDAIEEVQVAPGWRAWYLDAPLAYVKAPNNCDKGADGYHCYWMRPEFRTNVDFANRIHGGVRSQKYFSYGRMHEAGLMQQATGIPPGARVRFSIWIQAWMCFDSGKCGKTGERSDQPSDMHLRVGIDPLGGTDPLTTSVAWSVEQPAWDKFVQFQVETVALSNTVTVFTHSRPEWDWARSNNDVYLDDASLVLVGAYATPTVTLPPQIRIPWRDRLASTATPFPAGAITHTVQMGDTLFGVALKYGVQISDVLRLNRITTSTELFVGQPLVVQIVPATPTPLPSPTTLATITPAPEPTITPMPIAVATAVLPPTPSAVVAAPPRPLPLAAMALIVTGVLIVSFGIGMRLTLFNGVAQAAQDQADPLRRKKR